MEGSLGSISPHHGKWLGKLSGKSSGWSRSMSWISSAKTVHRQRCRSILWTQRPTSSDDLVSGGREVKSIDEELRKTLRGLCRFFRDGRPHIDCPEPFQTCDLFDRLSVRVGPLHFAVHVFRFPVREAAGTVGGAQGQVDRRAGDENHDGAGRVGRRGRGTDDGDESAEVLLETG